MTPKHESAEEWAKSDFRYEKNFNEQTRMSAQVEAKKIFYEYKNILQEITHQNVDAEAKQCALKHVQGILDYSKMQESCRNIDGDEYWQEVKKTIENYDL